MSSNLMLNIKNSENKANKHRDFKFPKLLLYKLYKERKRGFKCDITFNLESEDQMKAHKCFLVQVVPYFRGMFNPIVNEDKLVRVDMKNLTRSVLDPMLNFVYTDKF